MGKYTKLALVEQGTIKVEDRARDGLNLEIQRREAEYIPNNHYWDWGQNAYGKGRG